MPPQGPPDFILHASKILSLSPELLRLAKRNESISPALRSQLLECFHRFLSLCPASYSSLMRLRGAGESDAAHDADMSSREILLKICTALILSRVWPLYTFKTYLKRLQTLTPHFDVGVPATLQLTALRSLSYSAQKCSYQSEEGSVSLHQLDELQRMTYRFNRILLKLKQLKQLEQSRLKRMQRILKDEFIVSLRLKHKEVVLSLAAFLPKLDSKEVLQSKLLHVAKAHKEARTAALNEGEFIK